MRLPIEDAVELLKAEGYTISKYPKGIDIEIPDTFTPAELYEMVMAISELEEEPEVEEEVEEIHEGTPLEESHEPEKTEPTNIIYSIDRFDKTGIDITFNSRYFAPILYMVGYVRSASGWTEQVRIRSESGKIHVIGFTGIELFVMEKGIGSTDMEKTFYIDLDMKTKDTTKLKKFLDKDVPIRIASYKIGEGVLTIGNEEYPIKVELGENKKLPDIGFNFTIIINPEDFYNAVKSLSEISDVITIETGGRDTLMFSASSVGEPEIYKHIEGGKQRTMSGKVVFENIAYKNSFSEEKSHYNLIKLSMLADVIKDVKEPIEIQFGTDYPIRIDFLKDGVPYVYMLAPKVDVW